MNPQELADKCRKLQDEELKQLYSEVSGQRKDNKEAAQAFPIVRREMRRRQLPEEDIQ